MTTDILVTRACPVCEAEQHVPFLTVPDHQSEDDFQVVECKNCKALYLNPVPHPKDIGRYYETFTGAIMHKEGNLVFDWLRGFAIARELSPLLRRIGREKVIADLGTGSGQVASFLHKEGRSVLACDNFDPATWSHKEVPFKQVDLNGTLQEPLSATGAILRHVLEHVHEPRRVFSWLWRSGVEYVFVLVPNSETRLRDTFGADWAYWDPPRHLTFFTSNSLREVAERTGYRQVASGDHGLDEVVTSLFRAKMLEWTRTPASERPSNPWWVPVLNPKGALSAISSALVSSFGKGALCRLFQRVE